jgi:hypothetical protein
MERFLNIFNIYELSPAEHIFFEPLKYKKMMWHGYSAQPSNAVESFIKKPKIGRYRAALELTADIKKEKEGKFQSVAISHSPGLSALTAHSLAMRRISIPHIAFAFNYTKLPTSIRKNIHQQGFQSIQSFIVFSTYEVDLYSRYFNLPSEKFRYLPWTQSCPTLAEKLSHPFGGRDYLCAVGGEGRDYQLLVEAAKISKIPVLIIGRESSIKGLVIPENVIFRSNLPMDVTWGYAKMSQGLVIPLLTNETCCGQITIVSGLMLGIPVVITNSIALRDYTKGYASVLTYQAGEVEDLIQAMNKIINDKSIESSASADIEKYRRLYDRSNWTAGLENIIESLCCN